MSEAERESRVGSQIGPYRLRRLLGKGGMGEVYEAEDTVKDRIVALKLLPESASHDPVFRKRLQREAHSAGRLQEPHVVPIHDYGEVDGLLYVDMRMIDGTDLRKVLKRFGPMTPARAVAIVRQIASALDAAHESGVMHRDVKPENIILTRDDFAYLVDFGIANAATDEKLTELGTAVGTYAYMAPERFTNDEVTYRADVYALACVLHECLTGSQPYPGDSVSVVITAHLMQPMPKPSEERPGIPAAFDEVIARGMAKKPEERFASAGDLAIGRERGADRTATRTRPRRSCSAARPRPCRARQRPPNRPHGRSFRHRRRRRRRTPPPTPRQPACPAGRVPHATPADAWPAERTDVDGTAAPPRPPGPPRKARACRGCRSRPRPRVFVLVLGALGIWLLVKPDDSSSTANDDDQTRRHEPTETTPTDSADHDDRPRDPSRSIRSCWPCCRAATTRACASRPSACPRRPGHGRLHGAAPAGGPRAPGTPVRRPGTLDKALRRTPSSRTRRCCDARPAISIRRPPGITPTTPGRGRGPDRLRHLPRQARRDMDQELRSAARRRASARTSRTCTTGGWSTADPPDAFRPPRIRQESVKGAVGL